MFTLSNLPAIEAAIKTSLWGWATYATLPARELELVVDGAPVRFTVHLDRALRPCTINVMDELLRDGYDWPLRNLLYRFVFGDTPCDDDFDEYLNEEGCIGCNASPCDCFDDLPA